VYRKILVPLDGSSFSERVLAHLRGIVTLGHTQVILLRVLEPYRSMGDIGYSQALAGVTEASLRAEAKQYLKCLQGELRELGIATQTRVAEGDVTSIIRAIADDEQIDLIAMTTHGRSGVSRWALGSVADHVLRVVRKPILLVRGDTPLLEPGVQRKILVPLDGSAFAEQVLRQAQTLARESEATVILLRALDLKTDRELDGMMAQAEGHGALRAIRARAAAGYLSQVELYLHQRGVRTESLIYDLPPAESILDAAEREQVGLIVMSTHARSGLGRWVYGSVADAVLRGAHCPVLLNHASEEPTMETYVLNWHMQS
jgi:nucleotide-binding universal stress UspA family protein